jgi:uncharacterized protein (TIGR02118 family)
MADRHEAYHNDCWRGAGNTWSAGQYRVGSEVRAGCTYHNNQNSHWERSNGKSCRPLQKSEKHRSLREHYSSVHIPLAKKIPGLKKFDISTGAVGTPAGPSGIHLVATLYFDSADALKAGLASAEGKQRLGILPTLWTAGRSSTSSIRKKFETTRRPPRPTLTENSLGEAGAVEPGRRVRMDAAV